MKPGVIFIALCLCLNIVNNVDAQRKNKKEEEPIVLIKTAFGNMKVKLYNETPVHRDNFLKLVAEHFYDSLLFHRVIKEFMIQGGDPESKNTAKGKTLGSGGPGYTLPAEIVPKYFHKKGALSAARTGDRANPQRRSSGSQFYIVQGKTYTEQGLDNLEKRMHTEFTDQQREDYSTIGGTPHLDAQYTVFGEVIEGIEVLDKIALVATNEQNRPVADVIMTIEIIK